MAKKSAKKAAKKEEKKEKMVKGYLGRDYRGSDGKVYGPGEVEVPESQGTIISFFTDKPE